jgi:hypothetical protein
LNNDKPNNNIRFELPINIPFPWVIKLF